MDRDSPDQTVWDVQGDLGLCYVHMPEDMLSHDVAHIITRAQLFKALLA